MVHLEISHIILILCYLCHIFSTFGNNFWNNHKNVTVFEKDSWRLFKITFRSFNALHVMHANTYLHTLCTKNINTFYTSKDSYIFFLKVYEQLSYVGMLSGWGNFFQYYFNLELEGSGYRCSKRKLKEICLWCLEKNWLHINKKFKEPD